MKKLLYALITLTFSNASLANIVTLSQCDYPYFVMLTNESGVEMAEYFDNIVRDDVLKSQLLSAIKNEETNIVISLDDLLNQDYCTI